MVNVVSDRAHALVSVALSGHPSAEALEAMTTKLKEAMAKGRAAGLLFQVEHFCGLHAEALMAETLFKHLTVDLMKDAGLERIALVGERSWQRWVTGVLRPVVQAEVRYFEPERLAAAWAWLHEANTQPYGGSHA